jgi:hypothetical protein
MKKETLALIKNVLADKTPKIIYLIGNPKLSIIIGKRTEEK